MQYFSTWVLFSQLLSQKVAPEVDLVFSFGS